MAHGHSRNYTTLTDATKMDIARKAVIGGLLAASALVAPQHAWAKAASVEDRLDRLEAEMTELRGDLASARQENQQLRIRAEQAEARAQAAETQARATDTRLAALESKPAPAPVAQPDGFKSGATTFKLGGYLKLLAASTRYSEGEVATNSLGRDFYLPQTIPTGTGPASLLAKMDDPAAISAALSNGQGEQMMREAYRDLIELPSANRSFARFFTELAESESLPALFHCTTGKDRTGWAAATTLTFLGVSREDVYHDYLQTNPQLLPALKPIFDQFESVGGNPGDLRPVLSVDRSYLDTAMDLMHERYGSIDGYMKEGLGLGPEILEALRARLLVG